MTRFFSSRFTLAASVLVAASAISAKAQYVNGQAAATVLGQPNYTTNTASSTQIGFNRPRGVVSDPATGKLFVIDSINNRILRFSSANALASGTTAELVFGQTNFTANTNGTALDKMSNPFSATVDSAGNLWVADSANNRILRFADAASTLTNGPTADSAIGTGTAGTTQSQLKNPYGVSVDSTGALYVADTDNNRVLRFNNAASLSAGAQADAVFGQSNFLSSAIPQSATASTCGVPYQVAVDADDNLYVADALYHRVLRFENPAGKGNGANADAVFGQTSFTTSSQTSNSAGMSQPSSIAFDPAGRLYVGDAVFNRILIFENPLMSTAGATASLVLGQADFTTTAPGLTQTTFDSPWSISFSPIANRLYVSDLNNSRVLSFTVVPGTPTLSTSPRKPKIKVGVTKNVGLVVRNSSVNSDAFTVKITTQKNFSSRGRVKYLFNGADVTSAIKAGTFRTGQLSSNQSAKINMQIRPLKESSGKLNFTGFATSVTDTAQTTKRAVAVKIIQP